MLKNDQLDQWDRESFFHPSTHLAQHARGESPSRVIKTASGVHIEDRNGVKLLDAFAGLYFPPNGFKPPASSRSASANLSLIFSPEF